jgi:hypothetical protein
MILAMLFLPLEKILTRQDLRLSVLLSTYMMLISSSRFGFLLIFQLFHPTPTRGEPAYTGFTFYLRDSSSCHKRLVPAESDTLLAGVYSLP